MGIITVTKLKCDKCGLEANCAGFTPNEAKTIMRKDVYRIIDHVLTCNSVLCIL